MCIGIYAGQYFDEETGLHYNLNRYYNPKTGRYLRADPFGDGLNLYVYCYNNPQGLIDPLGLCAAKKLWGFLKRDGSIFGSWVAALANQGLVATVKSLHYLHDKLLSIQDYMQNHDNLNTFNTDPMIIAPPDNGLIGNLWSNLRSDAKKFYLGDDFGPNTRVNIAGKYSYQIMVTALVGGGLMTNAKIAYHAYGPSIGMAATDVVTSLFPGPPVMNYVGVATATLDRVRTLVPWNKVKNKISKVLFGDTDD